MSFERPVPRTIAREPERRLFKLPFWFNRFELAIVLVSSGLLLTVGYFVAGVWGVLGSLVASGCIFFGVARWKKGKPPSYMWESFYRSPWTRWAVRAERWFPYSPEEQTLDPAARPQRSLYNGTLHGGLAATEPWHEYAPPFGDPDRPLMAWSRFAKVRMTVETVAGAEPAPAWFAIADPPAWARARIDAEAGDAKAAKDWLVRPSLSVKEVLVEVAYAR